MNAESKEYFGEFIFLTKKWLIANSSIRLIYLNQLNQFKLKPN